MARMAEQKVAFIFPQGVAALLILRSFWDTCSTQKQNKTAQNQKKQNRPNPFFFEKVFLLVDPKVFVFFIVFLFFVFVVFVEKINWLWSNNFFLILVDYLLVLVAF